MILGRSPSPETKIDRAKRKRERAEKEQEEAKRLKATREEEKDKRIKELQVCVNMCLRLIVCVNMSHFIISFNSVRK
jgi:hypothetical protein